MTINVESTHAEDPLVDQKHGFSDVVELSPYGMYVVDQHLRIVSMNTGSQTGAFANVRPVIGRDVGEALGILWHEDVALEVVGHFRETLKTGTPYHSSDFRNSRRDIEVIQSYEWELHRIPLPMSSAFGVVCYYFDSTNLRDVEQELRHSRAAMEEERKRLELSDRRKDEFLATLGHELRNPLAPIGNAAALLQHPALTQDKVVRYAQMIERQARAMAVLLDDLLEVSRISTGKLQLKKTSVSVASLIDTSIEPVRQALAAKMHSLRVEMDNGQALLSVDPVRMSQVLTNLLTNAIKYSDPGSSMVLRTSSTPTDFTFEVIDSGIGISSEKLGSIFEMFAQVTPSIERSEGGLGIGLAVAKALVEMHGGRLEASSPGLGHGSTFKLMVPRGDVLEPAPVTAESRLPVSTSSQVPVVVADDNVDSAESLAAVLELDGYSVHIARDGVEALELATRFKPIACFLDIGMPRLNGFEVAKELRRLNGAAAPFLVATTGWGQAEDKRRALEAGFDVHLTKPISLNEASKLLAQRKVH